MPACSVQQCAYGVGDLAAAAVPHRDVHQQAVDVRGRLRGDLESFSDLGGQQVQRTDGVQPPAALLGQRLDGVDDDPEQRLELARRTVQVVGREQPQGHHLDADLLAPTEHGLDVGGAGAMTLGCVGPDGLGPPPVAVQHHADVLGEPLGGKAAVDPRLVRRIEHPSQPSLPVHHSSDCTGGRAL